MRKAKQTSDPGRSRPTITCTSAFLSKAPLHTVHHDSGGESGAHERGVPQSAARGGEERPGGSGTRQSLSLSRLQNCYNCSATPPARGESQGSGPAAPALRHRQRTHPSPVPDPVASTALTPRPRP